MLGVNFAGSGSGQRLFWQDALCKHVTISQYAQISEAMCQYAISNEVEVAIHNEVVNGLYTFSRLGNDNGYIP